MVVWVSDCELGVAFFSRHAFPLVFLIRQRVFLAQAHAVDESATYEAHRESPPHFDQYGCYCGGASSSVHLQLKIRKAFAIFGELTLQVEVYFVYGDRACFFVSSEGARLYCAISKL